MATFRSTSLAKPGRELYEELFYDRWATAATRHPKILRPRRNEAVSVDIERALAELARLLDKRTELAARTRLFELIQRSLTSARPKLAPMGSPCRAAGRQGSRRERQASLPCRSFAVTTPHSYKASMTSGVAICDRNV